MFGFCVYLGSAEAAGWVAGWLDGGRRLDYVHTHTQAPERCSVDNCSGLM